MDLSDEQIEQLLIMHASLLHAVVSAYHQPTEQAELISMLNDAEKNGWQNLCGAINAILAHQHEDAIFDALDAEEAIIIRAILQGIDNPAALPANDTQQHFEQATAGFAAAIAAASQGDSRAMQLIEYLQHQLHSKLDQSNLNKLSITIQKMLYGERNAAILIDGMDINTASFVQKILINLENLYTTDKPASLN